LIWTEVTKLGSEEQLDKVQSLTEKYGSQMERHTIIEDIVPNIYSGEDTPDSTNEFRKMCNLISKLTTIPLKHEGFAAMLERMLRFSNWDNRNSITLASKIKNADVQLSNQFPESIRTLLYNSDNCLLKDSYYNDYIYVVPDENGFWFDDERRRVFHFRQGTFDWKSYWTIELRSDGGLSNDAYFAIKSNATAEYLYTGDEDKMRYKKDRRFVMTWKSKEVLEENCEWYFIPVEDAQYFRIKNRKLNEFMYADGDKAKRDEYYVNMYMGLDLNERLLEETKFTLHC